MLWLKKQFRIALVRFGNYAAMSRLLNVGYYNKIVIRSYICIANMKVTTFHCNLKFIANAVTMGLYNISAMPSSSKCKLADLQTQPEQFMRGCSEEHLGR